MGIDAPELQQQISPSRMQSEPAAGEAQWAPETVGADLYREFLRLPLCDELIFIGGIRELLLRAWTERCRVI